MCVYVYLLIPIYFIVSYLYLYLFYTHVFCYSYGYGNTSLSYLSDVTTIVHVLPGPTTWAWFWAPPQKYSRACTVRWDSERCRTPISSAALVRADPTKGPRPPKAPKRPLKTCKIFKLIGFCGLRSNDQMHCIIALQGILSSIPEVG